MINIERLIDFKNYSYNWKKIERVDEFAVLKKCEQNPRWHAEGNAWEHTKLVCKEMVKILKEKHTLSEYEVKVLLTAALFHDIGKGVTTEFKKGNWHAYGHEIQSERITRKLLWNENITFREDVCSLVRWHMEPLQIFESGGKDYIERVLRLSKRCSLKLVFILKLADVYGSIQKDNVSKGDDIKKINFLIELEKCICRDLPLPGSFAWELKERKVKVLLLMGLPGAGKDTYIDLVFDNEEDGFTRENTVVVCRDDIRADLGFCKKGDKIVGTRYQEDRVSKVFNDKMIEAAEAGKNIIINNINLKKKYRDDYHELLANYNPYFKYAYIQADDIEKNYVRRNGQIEEEVFEDMMLYFEWPYYPEYDAMTIVTN